MVATRGRTVRRRRHPGEHGRGDRPDRDARAPDYPVEEFRAIFDLNVVGTFLPSKYVTAPDRARRRQDREPRGHLRASRLPQPQRVLLLEVGDPRVHSDARARARPHDITVNTVCPNVTHGGRMDKIVATKAERLGTTPEQVYDDFAAQTALGRFVEEEDIAAAIDFLVSEGAKNITGHDIPVDAGWDV